MSKIENLKLKMEKISAKIEKAEEDLKGYKKELAQCKEDLAEAEMEELKGFMKTYGISPLKAKELLSNLNKKES